jgi:ABC-2 type transport system ATP-binding protein
MELNIEAKNISVDFPVYSHPNRSLRRALFSNQLTARIKRKSQELTQPNYKVGANVEEDSAGRILINALQDINLNIKEGERVGILGHNGAGKSTLLKVLSGIYEPISGSLNIVGKPTPMFNLSDGMDEESTGIENIWLRLRLLGAPSEYIEDHIADIAEFTELGEFLDLPIRTYSSGMLLRLLFAVATSVNPEILLMDELVGAGDANFVERANTRLAEFVDRSGIMIVATHNTKILSDWCTRGIVLERGRISMSGGVDDAINYYKEITG